MTLCHGISVFQITFAQFPRAIYILGFRRINFNNRIFIRIRRFNFNNRFREREERLLER